MLIFSLRDADDSSCSLFFDEQNHWLYAQWCCYIEESEAMRGAETYLEKAGDYPCAYLLNDNVQLEGPWFDSLEWLQQAWLPHAQRLGLRYIAHVMQVDTHFDVLTRAFSRPLTGELELQLFDTVSEAQDWLRSCQQNDTILSKRAG